MIVNLRRLMPVAAIVLMAGLSGRSASAQLLVSPTITSLSNGLYHYNYTITNNTGQDIYLIDINTAHQANAVTNLLAPTGFQKAFDSGLGLVSFLEDTSSFSTTPLSGFQFDSIFQGGQVLFAGDYLDNNFNNQIVSGTTRGPVSTPEPGSLAILVTLSASGAFYFRRKRSKTK